MFLGLLSVGLAWGLEVASYNTWGLPPPLTRASRKSRLPGIARWLEERSFDLVGLSEVWGSAARLMSGPGLLAASQQRGDTGLAVQSRLPVGRARTLHFRDASGFDRFKQKGAMIVPVAAMEGQLTMVVTHLQASPRAAGVRATQLAELLVALENESGPVVLVGDFNFYAAEKEDQESGAALRGAGFVDSLEGSESPTHLREAERFDRIYVRNGREAGRLKLVVEESSVLGLGRLDPERRRAATERVEQDHAVGELLGRLSDHLPVRARIRLETGEAR